ncbi:GNAT family N-acetyltransferase [Endozoicomonas arenosclerae]|uniref:GNAT family N-acetyltransferase n=1 Tax=Endozoicomonas arenosclerae TaxID=1633495 RepID=UPI001560F741|nr:GNAT family N-acetyltransferase [Endozoicomonas arenosclerae]
MKTFLADMSEAAFKQYLESAIPFFAELHIKSGQWQEADATKRAEEAYKRMFPDGVNSENCHCFEIKENTSENTIGFILIQVHGNYAFIHEIEIYEAHRRKGYAKSALCNVEEFLTGKGIIGIELEVGSQNNAAHALYDEMGFSPVSTYMRKRFKPVSE